MDNKYILDSNRKLIFVNDIIRISNGIHCDKYRVLKIQDDRNILVHNIKKNYDVLFIASGCTKVKSSINREIPWL